MIGCSLVAHDKARKRYGYGWDILIMQRSSENRTGKNVLKVRQSHWKGWQTLIIRKGCFKCEATAVGSSYSYSGAVRGVILSCVWEVESAPRHFRRQQQSYALSSHLRQVMTGLPSDDPRGK